jgi:hypothetical protein
VPTLFTGEMFFAQFFQRCAAFITPLSIDKNTNLIFKKVYRAIGNSFPYCSLRHRQSLHDVKQKLQLKLSALLPILCFELPRKEQGGTGKL